MRTRTRNALVLLAVAAPLCAAVLIAARSVPPRPPLRSALQAIPETAAVVLTVRLDRLRASPFSPWLQDVTANQGSPACGQRLLQRVQEAAVWIPEGSERDFGLAARGEVGREELAECAREAIGARGGAARVSQSEGFWLIEDRLLGPGAASLALGEGGQVFLARPTHLSPMIESAKGQRPSALLPGEHRRMREALELEGDAVLTARLSGGLRQQLRDLLGPETILTTIVAAAAALRVDSLAHLRVLLWCDTAQNCDRIARVAEVSLAQARQAPSLRLLGVASVLQTAVVRSQGAQLLFEAKAPAEEVVSLLQRLGQSDQEPMSVPSPALSFPKLSMPDEVLRPPRLGDGGP